MLICSIPGWDKASKDNLSSVVGYIWSIEVNQAISDVWVITVEESLDTSIGLINLKFSWASRFKTTECAYSGITICSVAGE